MTKPEVLMVGGGMIAHDQILPSLYHLERQGRISAISVCDAAFETLEKLARALECPLYQLFYDGEEPPQLPNLPKRKSSDDIAWGSAGKEARYLNKLRRLLSKADDEDRKLLLYMAQKMANR